jgi:hypothetical protein
MATSALERRQLRSPEQRTVYTSLSSDPTREPKECAPWRRGWHIIRLCCHFASIIRAPWISDAVGTIITDRPPHALAVFRRYTNH